MQKLLVLFSAMFLILGSCKTRTDQNNLLVISPDATDNKVFTFTNKFSGFYLGNTHKVNGSGHDGWTVSETHYLLDYRIYENDILIHRDSLAECIYDPAGLIRKYPNALVERFVVADSLDALLWIFELPASMGSFSFEPVLHHQVEGKQNRLSNQNPQLIFSPAEIIGGKAEQNIKWMGMDLFEDQGKWVVIAHLAQSELSVKQGLENLHYGYVKRLAEREKRQREIIARNDLRCSVPELNQAVTWAQISLDALVTQQRGKGIWAGLPWFNNYWGRDTFISFAGALLVSGQFDDAASILRSFSTYQLSDSADRWYGRIPNRITNTEVIYNTADGTWWFIRELYEYALYTGDTGTVRELFPTVKKAISGALKYRIDPNFFLVHEDAETWMDAKGREGAWSPRGDRAVEIQSLWYTALQAGAIMASISEYPDLSEHWLAISQTLRDNFIKEYWNSFSMVMTDHLNADGSRDRKLRPNQIFTVSVPDLAGIEPLVNDEIKAHITSRVLTGLTYRYGVASLSQEDPDFHPWHHYEPFYVQDEAYHNGTVWTWLAGPLVGALTDLGYEDLAFHLTFNESVQILNWNAIGNFSELLDALPRPGSSEPLISGTVSQAWSLAEFVRNMYQHFIGYRPNSLAKTITFKPAIPYEISTLSVRLPYESGWIDFDYREDEEYFTFIFNRFQIAEKLNIVLKFPGYADQFIEHDPDADIIEIKLPLSTRQMYQRFPQLDWYFAQPELKPDLETIKKPDYPILHSSDFYLESAISSQPILVANDPLFDDTGPNGRYLYPQNPLFAEGLFDVNSMELYDLGKDWGFILKFRDLVNPNWHPAYGFQLTYAAIAIRNPRAVRSGRRDIGKSAGHQLSPDRAYHNILYIGGGVTLENSGGETLVLLYPDDPFKPLGDNLAKKIRFRLPKNYLPYLDKNTIFTVLTGGQDDHGGAGIGDFRAVLLQPGPWHGGGADIPEGASRVYDIFEINR